MKENSGIPHKKNNRKFPWVPRDFLPTIRILWLEVLVIMIAGCSVFATPTPTPTPTLTPLPSPTPTLAPPVVEVISPADPSPIAEAYLDAWVIEDYQAMYDALTLGSQEVISQTDFIERYLNVVVEAAVPEGAIEYELITEKLFSPTQARVEYRVILNSLLIGEIVRETQMDLVMEDGEWRVAWDASMIMPELAGGNVLRVVNFIPQRGDIYDRYGELLIASASEGYALGIVPGEIGEDFEAGLLSVLSRATGNSIEYLLTLYANEGFDYPFYIPIASASTRAVGPYFDAITSYDGAYITSFQGRYYSKLAPQTLGFLSAIQPEEVDNFKRNGYQWTERVARDGLELTQEELLGGQRGGAVFLDDAQGGQVAKLGETPAQPSSSIYTTLDATLQLQAQNALATFRGAVVVMERDTGRVLAMASSPGFDPNLFEPTNLNSQFTSPLFDPGDPLFNRATQGQYPLGSVFKIITLSAALESGLFTPEDIYDCQYEFYELDGVVLYDWTLEFEQDPSGVLTLPEGLMRSCNPWFYHIGVELYEQGLTESIAEMARGFGLGQATGIPLPQEADGSIPSPTEPFEAAILAIGQGEMLVTPLQVATFVAAVGNGGTMYQPQLIEQVVNLQGEVVYSFEPIQTGTLPVSSENLEIVRNAMETVINNVRGTAYYSMGGFPRFRGIDLYGKTGTAELGGGLDPHSWFVVYTDEQREDLPDLAIAVIVETIGEGSEYAAPISRRILETYFFGRPLTVFEWEARVGVPEVYIPEEEEDPGEGEGENGGGGETAPW